MLHDILRDYVQRGFSLVPFKAIPPKSGETKWKKTALVKWEDRKRQPAPLETVLSEFKKFPDALIGCVTGPVSGFVNLDIDDEEGQVQANELVPDSLHVPCYKTLSGGLQMIFAAPDPCPSGAVRFLPGLDFRGLNSCTILPGDRQGRYRWMDGCSLEDVQPAPLPCALLSALNNNNTNIYNRECVDSAKLFTNGRHDNDLFHTANHLVKGGMPEHEIKQVLERIILSWGEKPDEKWIDAKIKSALQRAERRDRTLSTDVREWVLSTSGVFLSTDIYQCLHLSTRDDKKNVSIILKRMCDDNELERYGNKNGQFRRIDNDIQPLDWKTADTAPLNLIWPFGIHNLVNLYPGNIGIIAGYPNAGKTAFIHNLIRLNQNNHDVHLFSSEGGREELKMRLSKFDCSFDDWKFSYYERSGDFADVIKPDAINIIDYLELHDDFYKVGGIIKSISDKLNSGFALIAIQKNSGRDEGLGGARGLEKPRLYLAMDSGRLKIVKAKSWVDSRNNPNGQTIKFKIVDGCKFIIESRWEKQ